MAKFAKLSFKKDELNKERRDFLKECLKMAQLMLSWLPWLWQKRGQADTYYLRCQYRDR